MMEDERSSGKMKSEKRRRGKQKSGEEETK